MTDNYSGCSVLVSGGAGFIGSHLVDELVRRNARVTVLDNLSTGRRSNLSTVIDQLKFTELDCQHDDLRPVLADNGFDLMFHIAGSASVPASVEDPRRDLGDNLVATFNLLEASRQAARRARIVHVSSASVYGQGVRVPMHEEDPTVPVSPYGVSKLASERYVAVYSELYGLRTTSLRLFPIYGPRLRKQVVYDLMWKLHKNSEKLEIHGDGTEVRDLNHVANVVDALLLVAERASFKGEVYNVASDSPVSIQDLARMICERMNLSPRFVYSGAGRPGDTYQFYADISRLKGLGYQPRIGLPEGLTDTVAWFRQEAAGAASG